MFKYVGVNFLKKAEASKIYGVLKLEGKLIPGMP